MQEDLRALFFGRPGPPAELPRLAARPPRVPAADAEDAPGDAPPPGGLPVAEIVQIKYVDSAGAESSRRITIRSIVTDRNGDLTVHAICHERHAPRRFKASRIEEIFDLTTGELFEDVRAFLLQRAPLPDGLDGRDRGTADLLRTLRAELICLAWLAGCDGSRHRAEIRAIAGFVEERAAGRAYDADAVLGHVARLRVAAQDVDFALSDVLWPGTRLDEAARERLLAFGRACVRVVLADDALADREAEFVDKLCAAFARAGLAFDPAR